MIRLYVLPFDGSTHDRSTCCFLLSTLSNDLFVQFISSNFVNRLPFGVLEFCNFFHHLCIFSFIYLCLRALFVREEQKLMMELSLTFSDFALPLRHPKRGAGTLSAGAPAMGARGAQKHGRLVLRATAYRQSPEHDAPAAWQSEPPDLRWAIAKCCLGHRHQALALARAKPVHRRGDEHSLGLLLQPRPVFSYLISCAVNGV